MEFSMMTVDGDVCFDACKCFLIMNLESLEKMQGMGCSDECIKEALNICLNHAGNLYVCGMIEEEFFRFILGDIVVNDAIDMLIDDMNVIRKYIVKCTG